MSLGTINVRFKADVGIANFTKICGWLAYGLRKSATPGSTFTIEMGSGHKDNVLAVAKGEVDVALTTPPFFAAQAGAGVGLYEDGAIGNLRAIGTIPQHDRLTLAVDANTGITSFEDVREQRYPLRISTEIEDGNSGVGWAAARVLEAYGISVENLRSWGGDIVPCIGPIQAVQQCISGTADAVFHEGIMATQWDTLTDTRTMRFLPIRQGIMDDFQRRYLLTPGILPRGKFRGVVEDVPTLGWSDFVILVGASMEDELAHTLAKLLIETWDMFEAGYRHLSPEKSSVSYPLNPYSTWRDTGAPLHPGAQRYYQDHGYMAR